jgi:hypothetical protein
MAFAPRRAHYNGAGESAQKAPLGANSSNLKALVLRRQECRRRRATAFDVAARARRRANLFVQIKQLRVICQNTSC